jgi:hypothetical protein
MSLVAEVQVGPRYELEGSENLLRSGRTAELIIGDGHGKYHEATSRGNVYVGGNTAAQAVTVATTIATGLCLTNPLGSGKMISILDIEVSIAAAVAAVFQVSLFANLNVLAAAVTQTTPITPRNALLGSALAPVGLLASSFTLPASPTCILPLLASGWVTGTAQSQLNLKEEIGGAITLLPNTAVSIQSIVGTPSIIGSFTWEEILI